MMKKFFIAPSILSANFSCLEKEIRKLVQSGADIIHLDIMDNHFVPNLTFGPIICKSISDWNISIPIEVHLMTYQVDKLIPKFIDSGASRVIFHVEATKKILENIKKIKNYGCKSGLAFNPLTPLDILNIVNIENEPDIILIMSVNPGFSGQKFLNKSLKKIKKAKEIIQERRLKSLIEVDGGINIKNISSIAKNGADIFVSGKEIFSISNYKFIIQLMKKKLKEAFK